MSQREMTCIVLTALVTLLAGCDQPALERQPKVDAYDAAPGWPNEQSAREPVAGTIARDEDLEPMPDSLPFELDAALLDRGQQRFDIFCSPCHDRTGHGNGMIVQRGFPSPPSFHSQRMREAPLRHYVDVITDGYGVMYAYRDRVSVQDRWAIAAYIKALQISQRASLDELSPEQRETLERMDAEDDDGEDDE